MEFFDKFGELIADYYEAPERNIMQHYIKPEHQVLEIGGRYGVVSCYINKLLTNPNAHVVIEPDVTVIPAMIKNRDANGCGFSVYPGAISDVPLTLVQEVSTHRYAGWGNWTRPPKDDEETVPTTTIENLQKQFDVQFDTLIVDCEGAILQILQDNKDILKQINLAIIERDGNGRCSYSRVDKMLNHFGLRCIVDEGLAVYARE